MGMRLVGLVQEALAINSDLQIIGKAAMVGGGWADIRQGSWNTVYNLYIKNDQKFAVDL